MRSDLTTALGHCVTDTTAIAFREQQHWRILDIGDAESRVGLLREYPVFAGLNPPAPTILCDPPEEE